MAISPELYQRFLQGSCTEEEELEVVMYFREHPGAMEDYLQAGGWEDFQASGKLHPAVTAKVLDRINNRISRQQRWERILRGAAAATVLTAFSALAWLLLVQSPRQAVPVTVAENNVKPAYRFYHNSSLSSMRLVLDDSSTVQLMPGSYLRHQEGFDSSRREIWLEGNARFQVAKDSRRPFTVYAGPTATTALGTSFGIRIDRLTQQVTVKLYSGKVMVRQHGSDTAAFATQYLLPGDALVYSSTSRRLQVTKAGQQTGRNKQPAPAEAAAPNALVYRQQPLTSVLSALEQHFNIQINYNKKTLSGIHVTAEFSSGDTPDQILQTIALLNELTVERTAAGVYILKK
jgi:ferric-dicitrate binding protein FerR (iron transport regulator)